MSEMTENIKQLALACSKSEELLATIQEELVGKSRRKRQNAAAVLAQLARIDVTQVAPYADDLIDALDRDEDQTRWEVLDALTEIVDVESRACDKAMLGAENALFDEDSGMVRLAALRFICKLGATTETRSIKAWVLLDEAIQCYHGDYEYQDMLIALASFAEGKLAPEVKTGLKERMSFDAANGHGVLKRRSQQIIDLLG